jgi:dienelactone hydrolase
VSFPAHGGARLDGVLVGRGSTGVVLVHQFPGDLCGWWQYAVYLAQHGFEALPIDLRCFGRSSCPKADQDDPVGDVAAAARVLLRSGVKRVAVIGASLGGTVAVIAGAHVSPRPSAVIDLSGELDDGHMLGPGPDLNAGAAAPTLRSPTLFVVSQTDAVSPVPDMQTVYRLTATRLKRLIVEPSAYGHGWDMLNGTYSTWSPLANILVGFLTVATRQ